MRQRKHRYEREREQRIAAIKAELAHRERRALLALAAVTVLATVLLAVVLAYLMSVAGKPFEL